MLTVWGTARGYLHFCWALKQATSPEVDAVVDGMEGSGAPPNAVVSLQPKRHGLVLAHTLVRFQSGYIRVQEGRTSQPDQQVIHFLLGVPKKVINVVREGHVVGFHHLPAPVVVLEVCRNLQAPFWAQVGMQKHEIACKRALQLTQTYSTQTYSGASSRRRYFCSAEPTLGELTVWHGICLCKASLRKHLTVHYEVLKHVTESQHGAGTQLQHTAKLVCHADW